MRRLLPVLLLALLSACAGQAPRPDGIAAASQVVEIDDLARVAQAVADNGGRRTLLVLDIDDTLLTSAGFFGSDAWYEWQKTLPAGDPGKVACLFDVISLNYEAGAQQATQADGPALIHPLVQRDALMLTSRNPLYRGGTLRTLRDAGYALPTMLDGRDEGRIWRWRKTPQAAPVTVSYDQGVFMTTGQDKGLVLLDLLGRLGMSYQRVVLVDDGEKNIAAMQAALRDAGIDYLGLHYRRVDKRVDTEKARQGRDGWQAWQGLLGGLYPQRMEAIKHGKCAY